MHNMWLWNCTHLRGLLKESLTHGACSTYKHFSHWWHRLNMPPSPQLSHSFRNAVKMSLKHFVLTVENMLECSETSATLWVEQLVLMEEGDVMLNSNMDDVTASNQYQPISCAHEKSERHAGITDMFTLKSFKIHLHWYFQRDECWKRDFCASAF